MSRTKLRAQAAVYLELYLYTRDRFSMSRAELRAQAAVCHKEQGQEDRLMARGGW